MLDHIEYAIGVGSLGLVAAVSARIFADALSAPTRAKIFAALRGHPIPQPAREVPHASAGRPQLHVDRADVEPTRGDLAA